MFPTKPIHISSQVTPANADAFNGNAVEYLGGDGVSSVSDGSTSVSFSHGGVPQIIQKTNDNLSSETYGFWGSLHRCMY